MGDRIDPLAVVFVALHRAVGEAEGEGGVGIEAVTENRILRLGDLGVGLLLDLADRFHDFSQPAGLAVDRCRQRDHRIARLLHRFGAAVEAGLVDLAARVTDRILPRLCRPLAEPRSLDELRGPVARRLAGEHRLDDCVIDAERPHHEGERVGELHRLEGVVDRLVGEQPQLHRLARRVAKLPEPLAAPLRLLFGSPEDRPGGGEILAVEGGAPFEKVVAQRDRVDLLLGILDAGKRRRLAARRC